MSSPTPPEQPNWLVRHKILTTILAVTVVGIILASANAETRQASTESSPTPTATVTVTETVEPTGGPTQEPTSEADASTPAPEESSAAPRPPRRHVRTYYVSRVVDGDTIELATGDDVRLVGIDTPERGDCGYDEATANMERLVLGKRVRLTISDEDTDRYGRLLRYVNIGRMDAGLRQIKAGLAIARYDSRDGYGYHPRENLYIATDKATPDRTTCRTTPNPAPTSGGGGGGAAPGCAPGYTPCVPPYPPDVDCADVNGPIQVTGSDPHGLDADGDGVACES